MKFHNYKNTLKTTEIIPYSYRNTKYQPELLENIDKDNIEESKMMISKYLFQIIILWKLILNFIVIEKMKFNSLYNTINTG